MRSELFSFAVFNDATVAFVECIQFLQTHVLLSHPCQLASNAQTTLNKQHKAESNTMRSKEIKQT